MEHVKEAMSTHCFSMDGSGREDWEYAQFPDHLSQAVLARLEKAGRITSEKVYDNTVSLFYEHENPKPPNRPLQWAIFHNLFISIAYSNPKTNADEYRRLSRFLMLCQSFDGRLSNFSKILESNIKKNVTKIHPIMKLFADPSARSLLQFTLISDLINEDGSPLNYCPLQKVGMAGNVMQRSAKGEYVSNHGIFSSLINSRQGEYFTTQIVVVVIAVPVRVPNIMGREGFPPSPITSVIEGSFCALSSPPK
ncbi:hypothetical protein LOAG_03970 [Loa loa]|uniref:Uncharacterized protein n=1 Tax=Loa loa TaxID=7209 RepID=A0A1S0U378_LOALO|nr:hypothetical protein LOAG_03970 [Loa loa]EFO24521.1 hypothetical protein LOAG_03970 [Loa loa]